MLLTNILYDQINPEKVNPFMLDQLLSMGWYRRRDTMFTSNIEWMEKDGEWIPFKVWWIRYNLDKLDYTAEAKRIWKRNRHFSFRASSLFITGEMRELYQKYIAGISFSLPPTPEEYLFSDSEEVFPSEVLLLEDDKQLVAAGVFDKGNNSIAGILNYYDPAYSSYSPGKYLMLLKMELAKKEGKQFYYPGYVVEGHSKFDYKLFPCHDCIEYYSWVHNGWLPFDTGDYLGGNFAG